MEDNVSLEEHLAILSRYADNVWGKLLEITGFADFRTVETERDGFKAEVSSLKMKLDEAANEKHKLIQRMSEFEKAYFAKTSENKVLEVKLLECFEAIRRGKAQAKNLSDELVDCRLHLARLESEKNASEGKKITLKQVDTYVVAGYNKRIE